MSNGKTRMTGFARLLVFLLIAGPLSYMAASYYNGEDGMQNIVDIFNRGKERATTTSQPKTTSTTKTLDVEQLSNRIRQLEKENRKLKQKVQYLEEQLAR